MPSEKSVLHPQTLAAQGLGRVAVPYRDIVPPIHVATTYERGADGSYPGGRGYSRADNPSYDQAEALIASLEGAAAALLFASGHGGGGSALPVLRARRSRARAAQHVLGAAQMAARVRRAVGARDRVLRKRIDRRSRREGARGAAEPHLDRDAGESHVGRHRYRRGVRDRTRGRRDRRRRFDGGDADADPSARARRARGHALGDQIPERPFRRDRGRARGGARRRALAAHSLPPPWLRRGARTAGSLAAAARDAHALVAGRGGERERGRDRRPIPRPRGALARALSRPADAPEPRGRRGADARRFRRHDVAALCRRRGSRETRLRRA